MTEPVGSSGAGDGSGMTSQGRKQASWSGWHRGSRRAGLGQGRRAQDGACEHQGDGRRLPHVTTAPPETSPGSVWPKAPGRAWRRGASKGTRVAGRSSWLRGGPWPAAAGGREAAGACGVVFPDFQEAHDRHALSRDPWVVSLLPGPRGGGPDVGPGLHPANRGPWGLGAVTGRLGRTCRLRRKTSPGGGAGGAQLLDPQSWSPASVSLGRPPAPASPDLQPRPPALPLASREDAQVQDHRVRLRTRAALILPPLSLYWVVDGPLRGT